jgi:hypothetical protein
VPLDRNAKARIMMLVRALERPTEKGKHYGKLTAKALDVLCALLWGFHNAESGKCFLSYEAIAEAAGCNISSLLLHAGKAWTPAARPNPTASTEQTALTEPRGCPRGSILLSSCVTDTPKTA